MSVCVVLPFHWEVEILLVDIQLVQKEKNGLGHSEPLEKLSCIKATLSNYWK